MEHPPKEKIFSDLENALNMALTFWKHEETSFNKQSYANCRIALSKYKEYKQRSNNDRQISQREKIVNRIKRHKKMVSKNG